MQNHALQSEPPESLARVVAHAGPACVDALVELLARAERDEEWSFGGSRVRIRKQLDVVLGVSRMTGMEVTDAFVQYHDAGGRLDPLPLHVANQARAVARHVPGVGMIQQQVAGARRALTERGMTWLHRLPPEDVITVLTHWRDGAEPRNVIEAAVGERYFLREEARALIAGLATSAWGRYSLWERACMVAVDPERLPRGAYRECVEHLTSADREPAARLRTLWLLARALFVPSFEDIRPMRALRYGSEILPGGDAEHLLEQILERLLELAREPVPEEVGVGAITAVAYLTVWGAAPEHRRRLLSSLEYEQPLQRAGLGPLFERLP